MKKKKQKVLAIVLALVMCLQYFVPITALAAKKVEVLHEEINGTNCIGYPGTFGKAQKVYVGKDRKVGFCIQPGVSSANGTHTEITPQSIGLTDKKIKRLSLIAWYGYRSKTHNNTNYCLTQSLIWKELGSPKRIQIGKYQTNDDMKGWFSDVLDKVDNFNETPSFNRKTYTVNAGTTKSIKDTKKVLSGLHIKSVTGGTAKKSGNTLIITPSGKVDKMVIKFDRGMSAAQTETNFVFRKGNAQAVSCLTGRDPYGAYVNIKVNLNGKAQVTKKSESGKAIKGAKFNIKNADGSVNKNGTTDENGKILFTGLAPGKYTVTETSVPSPYLIDKTPKTVTVKANIL